MEETIHNKIFKVNLREIKYFQTDDGRKIEEHTIIKKIEAEVSAEDASEIEDIPEETLYIGEANISIQGMTQTVKFPIQTDSLEKAFDNFYDCFEKTMESMQENQSHIVEASEQDLRMFDESEIDKKGNIIF
jgi:hypothetical protein